MVPLTLLVSAFFYLFVVSASRNASTGALNSSGADPSAAGHYSTVAPTPTAPAGTAYPPAHNYTSSSNSALPTKAPGDALSPDLAILAPRRIDFAVILQNASISVPDAIASLGPDGKWPDSEVDYTTGCPARRANWPAQLHWQRLGALAAAWHGGFPGADPKFVKDPALRAKLTLGLDWWFARDFKVDGCLDNGGTAACPCGTAGLWNTNWFSNVILIPRFVGQTCLLLNGTLTPSQLANCTHMTARTYTTFMRAEPPGWLVGANLLDIASIGIASGVLTGNDSLVTDAYARVHAEARVKTGFQVDGILTDGSFGQHAGLLYNGNYGKDYTNDVLELEIEAGGTKFAAVGQPKTAFETLMDGSRWMIYQNTVTGTIHWDFSTEGRFISFPVVDQQATQNININLTELQQLATLWGSSVLQDVFDGLTTGTGTANVGGLVGTRMFWNNDYMVARGANYVSTVKMYSTRTRNSECTNSQNTVGFHLADGTAYTYVRGDEYEDISAAWDWNLIPGITVDYGATPLDCNTENHSGLEKFVGGVSTGELGAAVMRYTNPITKKFSFQKAWFFFAGDVQHVMATVLASNSTAPVFSVLDQRTHRGAIYVDNTPVAGGNFSNPLRLFHADTGYRFEDAPTLSIAAGPRTGAWSAIGTSTQPPETVDLFAAWIAHGPEPAAADAAGAFPFPFPGHHHHHGARPQTGDGNSNTVAYTVFPGRSRWEFEADAAARPLRTLRADTAVSAVRDDAAGVTMAAFWGAGGGAVSVPGGMDVAASAACVLIVDEGALTVTVADPAQTLSSVQVTVSAAAGRGPRPRPPRPWQWGRSRTVALTVALPLAPGLAGSSVTVSLV